MPFFETREFDQDAFRGVEVQVCGKTKTVLFFAWDRGGADNDQSAAIPLEQAEELVAWLTGAIAAAKAES